MNFIKTHLKTHFSGNALHSSEMAKLVHRQMVHLEKTNYLTREENFAKSSHDLIDELKDSQNADDLPLALVDTPCFVHGQEFNGAHHEVDMEIMRKLARGDKTALDGYSNNQAEI